jgi:hypothetical protein
MIERWHSRRAHIGLALGVLLAAAVPAFAGSFYLDLDKPAPSTDPRLKDAVLVVTARGCIQTGTTNVSVTAEGLVNGQRRSIAVPVTRIASAKDSGTYAVKRQWPTEGAWVLVIHGSARNFGGGLFHLYQMLAWEPNAWAEDTQQDLRMRNAVDKPTPTEIDTMLRSMAAKGPAAARARASAR